MAKRKLTFIKKRRKKQKKNALPDIEDDDDLGLDLTIDESFCDDSVLDISRQLSPVSDDDAELLVGPYEKEIKHEKLKAGDLAWIRHDRKCSFWPSYVKSVSGNKLYAYFIGYNKFSKGGKSFGYNVNSKKVRRFLTEDYKEIVAEGKKFNQKLDDSAGLAKDAKGDLFKFNNAVELAEFYVAKYNSENFKDEADIFEFFNSNGLSLLQKQCRAEHNLSMSVQRQSALDESNDSTDLSLSTPSPTVHSGEKSPGKSHLTVKDLNGQSSLTFLDDGLSSSIPPLVTVTSEQSNLSESKKFPRKRKPYSNLQSFNDKNAAVVQFILDGNCDRHLLDILRSNSYSKRMAAFNDRWDKESLNPKTKNMIVEESYFEEQQQLEAVCKYFQNFASAHASDMVGLVKKGDLIFGVFVPEAIIYSIHKVRRRTLPRAERMYKEGCCATGRQADPLLMTPLTEEERLTMKRKIRNLQEELDTQCRFSV